MPKTLILITNHFPFGSAEGFIETEYPFLERKFSKILILCRDIVSKEIRRGKYNYYRVNPESNWKEYLLLMTLLFRHFGKVVEIVSQETSYLKTKRKLSTGRIKTLAHDISKALLTAMHIERIIKVNKLSGEVILYSYWLTSSALSTIFVRENNLVVRKISRTHGGDVFEERQAGSYLSFRNALAKNLDCIFCSNQSGIDYLKLRIQPNFHPKLILARLGTPHGNDGSYSSTGRKIIVSCSFMVPVKRIHFMIDSLSLIKQEIEWIHIGGGPLEGELKVLAQKKISNSPIRYSFLGTLSSAAIKELYRSTSVYLFMNTSSSEGIPVTMMEAQAFGIPILALDVGGVSEIVNDKVGRLLPADSTPADFSKALTETLNLPAEEYNTLRKQAWLNWSLHYNAEKNFSTFADKISNLN